MLTVATNAQRKGQGDAFNPCSRRVASETGVWGRAPRCWGAVKRQSRDSAPYGGVEIKPC